MIGRSLLSRLPLSANQLSGRILAASTSGLNIYCPTRKKSEGLQQHLLEIRKDIRSALPYSTASNPPNLPPLPPSSPATMGKKLKNFLKQYGKLGLGVYLGISLCSFTSIYIALRTGVDVKALMKSVGLPDSGIWDNAGTLAVAYAGLNSVFPNGMQPAPRQGRPGLGAFAVMVAVGSQPSIELKPATKIFDKENLGKCRQIISSISIKDGAAPDLNMLISFISTVPLTLTELMGKYKKDAKKTKRLQKTIKAFCEKSLEIVHESLTVPEDVLIGVLRVASNYTSLYREFPVLRKKFAKAVILIWATWCSDPARIAALLALHSLGSKYGSLLDICMREMYRSYAKSCKSSLSTYNLGQASLLLNGLVEIFSVNAAKGVEYGIRYLRQMAIAVQQAIRHPLKENMKKIFGWQFISLFRFWAHLLASQPPESAYSQLLFPLTSLMSCIGSFQHSPRHFAFYFHCVATSLELIERRGCMIPVTSTLLNIITYVTRQPLYKLEAKKANYDLVAIYKVSKSDAFTKNYLESVADEAFYYLFKVLKATPRITFPEIAEPIISSLKNSIKNPKIDRMLKKQIDGHLTKLIQQAREVKKFRIAESLVPIRLVNSSETNANKIPDELLIIDSYFGNIEKVRHMKRKLLIDKYESMDEGEKDTSKTNNSKSKIRTKQSSKSIKEKPSKVKPSKVAEPPSHRKRSLDSSNDDDIIEDFIIE